MKEGGRNTDRRIALVTGANKGIGFEIVKELAEKGFRVILTARNESRGKKALESLKDFDVIFHKLDVTNEKDVTELAKFIGRKFGRLDVVVNNAGIAVKEDNNTVSVDLEVLRETMETNFYGAFRVSQALIHFLLKSNYGGRIINISSSLGALNRESEPYHPVKMSAYSISKTALNSLTVNMAADLLDAGIKVNSMCPGWTKTDLGGSHADRTVKEAADTAIWLATADKDKIPTGRFFRDREEIAW